MTDPTPDHRAESALRDAFSRHAGRLDAVPLQVPRRRRRPRVLVSVTAAAFAVAAVVATTTVLGLDQSDPASPTSGLSDSPSTTSAAPTRTVSFLDVAIDVPAAWGDAYAPTDQWCVAGRGESDFPTEPYVALDASMFGSTNVGCGYGEPDADKDVPAAFPPVPERLWAPHVSLLPSTQARGGSPDVEPSDAVLTYGGWTLTTRTVGAVRIELLTDRSTRAAVEDVLASARVVATDANGCETTSPAQAAEFVRPPAFDIEELDTISEVVVCQYRRGGDTAGLLASQVLSGDEAQAQLEAMRAAPAGGGPDSPATCTDDHFGDEALVLRLRDGEQQRDDLYVYFDWCFGNGIDDGTTKRALTRQSCSPLFAGAVKLHSGSSEPFEVCQGQTRR